MSLCIVLGGRDEMIQSSNNYRIAEVGGSRDTEMGSISQTPTLVNRAIISSGQGHISPQERGGCVNRNISTGLYAFAFRPLPFHLCL